MNKSTNSSIYILSGPYGVGKSTLTKVLAADMEKVSVIEGDIIKNMLLGKEIPPLEKKQLMWKNILSLTQNSIENNINVIIDYANFGESLQWFYQQIFELNVKIYYVILRANRDTLINRLNKRGDDYLIEGSLYLLDQFEKELANKNHLYDTTNKQPVEIINDLKSIMEQFVLNFA
ncbi:AAA family ATPase [Neobacillus sp. LXY-1]|uniref:AAA family ATPase n=1 Tax=Neobacillus sp. LXY-1 TaxID=3379133 RepID=UPI003EE07272